MFTSRDGKGGELSSQVSKMLYKPPGAVYMYGLLTECEVKMAGYWPSPFLCVFTDRDEVEVHKLAKKRMRPIFSHLERTNWVRQ